MKKIVTWFKNEIHKLMELPDRPHAVAMGVACGVCIGFTPLVGIKTLLALIAAVIMRGNRLAACVVVNLHDVLLPLTPIMVVGQYKLGELILGRAHHQSKLAHIVWPPWREMFSKEYLVSMLTFDNMKTLFHEGMPLLLGSLIFGLALAFPAYYLTLKALQRAQARRLARKHEQELEEQQKHDAKS